VLYLGNNLIDGPAEMVLKSPDVVATSRGSTHEIISDRRRDRTAAGLDRS
jgi:hypothetical protein